MITTTATDQTNDRESLIRSYRSDVETFIRIASAQVPTLLERNPNAWTALEQMPFERLQALASGFQAYRDVCEAEFLKEGQITSIQSAWRLMRRLGLTPPSNLMSLLRETDVIEVYDLGFNQIFRNMNFFRVSSYTFEDLMHMPLSELFLRPPEAMLQLMKEAGAAFSGERRDAFLSAVPVHKAEERFSTKRYVAEIEQRVISPLFNETGHVLAVLASVDVKIVGSLKRPTREPFLV